MIGLVIDVILIVAALLLVIRHTRLGFVKSILNSVKAVAAALIAFFLRVHVARLFDEKFMNKAIVQWVYNSLCETANGGDPTVNLVSLYNDCTPAFNKLLAYFGLETEGLDAQFASISSMGEDEIMLMAENIGSSASWMLSLAAAIVAVFIVALIVLTVLIAVLNLVTKLPVIKTVNRILGAVIGLAWAVLLAWAIGSVVSVLINVMPDKVSTEIISDSVILGLLSEYKALDIVPDLIESYTVV